jgi:hypothetical protein|tara:strand:- start:9285 stop:9632 length:348 start_codon:yes stop_codon:yes gene_type:complete
MQWTNLIVGIFNTERLITLDGIDSILILLMTCTSIETTFGWIGHLDTLLIVAGIILVGITGVLIVGIIGTVATTVTTSGDIILQLITLTGKIEIETIEEYPTVKVEEVLPITTGM